jgi:hypothetical protein
MIIEVSVYKVGSLIQNVRVRGFDELKIRSVLRYMTDLKVENNEEIGHYEQTLIIQFSLLIGQFHLRFQDRAG